MSLINYQKLNDFLPRWKQEYQSGKPFPYICIDNFLDEEVADKVLAAFPKVNDEGWIHYIHYNERKHGLNKSNLIPKDVLEVLQELNNDRFVHFLEEISGINGLKADDMMEGGGLHQTEKGGKLNIHADFMVHTHKKNWLRRMNILIYLNKDWKEEYNGDLELWERDMSKRAHKIAPIFNRCVIFNTDKDSFHGVPDIVQCPEHMTRKSIALYYFTEEEQIDLKNPTNYQARPEDSVFKSFGIWADKQILYTYTRVKRTFGIKDDFASKLLNIFNKK